MHTPWPHALARRVALLAIVVGLVTAAPGPATLGGPGTAAANGTSDYVALNSSRILDTRTGNGAPAATVGPDSSIDLHVLGQGGVPNSGVTAVAVNITAVDPNSPTYITVWPTGQPRPVASNLNVTYGTTIANMVIATVGADGNISLYNERGNVHLLADVVGYYTGAGIGGLTPARILDTRTGIGAPAASVGPDSSIDLHVLGQGGVPDSGVTAVAVNVTAVDPDSPTYITVWPTGQPRPDASNLNVTYGTTIPNLVIATVGADGNISLYNERGNVHLLADVVGYFTGTGIGALSPARILDTRTGVGAPAATVGPNSAIDLHVLGQGGVPASGVTAVVVNVAAVDPTSPSYVTVWPRGQPRPDASNLNVTYGTTIANLVIAAVGTDGNITLYNERGDVHLLADVVGYFTGTSVLPPPVYFGPTPPASPPSNLPPVTGGTSPGALPLGAANYPAPANVVYVATNGNDGSSGNAGSPVATLNRAIALAPAGGTIVMQAGRYRESVAITKQVTIQNAPGVAVWLDGSSPVTGWVASGSTWRKDGWTTRFDHSPTFVQGAPDSSQQYWQFLNPAYPMAAHPDQVWIDGVEQQQVASLGQVTAGTFFLDEGSSQLYLGTNPSGRAVEASTIAKAISVRAPGVTIRGIGVRRYAPSVFMVAGITLESPSARVENVLIEDMATNGISALGTDITIEHVTVHNAGMLGLHARYADRLVVSSVLAVGNNAEHFNVAPNAGGMKVGHTRGLLVRNSDFSANLAHGFWIDLSVYDSKFLNNRFADNSADGLFLEISAKAVVADNLISGNGEFGLKVNNTSDVKIWNNTIVGNGRPLNIVQDPRRNTNPNDQAVDSRQPWPDPTMPWKLGPVVMANNVIGAARANANCLLCVEDYSRLTTAEQMGITANANIYNRPSGSQPTWISVWSRGTIVNPFVFTTLAALTAQTGQEANGLDLIGASIVDNNGTLAASVSSQAATRALPLPDDIAALTGQAVGTRHLGIWQ